MDQTVKHYLDVLKLKLLFIMMSMSLRQQMKLAPSRAVACKPFLVGELGRSCCTRSVASSTTSSHRCAPVLARAAATPLRRELQAFISTPTPKINSTHKNHPRHFSSIFNDLQLAPPDPILNTALLYQKDPDPRKVNLGIGAYRTTE